MELEENFRGAACIGDLDQLSKFVETNGVNINSRNNMNGWTALHWAAKRNHVTVVRYLLKKGADKEIKNSNGEIAAQLTTMEDIRNILEYNGQLCDSAPLAITPNYIRYPVFPYGSDQVPERSRPMTNSQFLHTDSLSQNQQNSEPQILANSLSLEQELVLKARVAYTDERDFIEVELEKNNLTFAALVSLLTRELGIDRKSVYKIRKLPNTILRKDKDVRRLQDFQELEVVLINKALCTSARGHGDFSEGYKTEQILY